MYARQALAKAGVLDKVQAKVVGGIDVSATLQFVARAEAEAGVVYHTDALVKRLGPRLGLTEERLGRITAVIGRRGRPALAVGRGTPGLRTVTVVAAGGTALGPRRSLPALVLGSSMFLQLPDWWGYAIGGVAMIVWIAVCCWTTYLSFKKAIAR